MIFRNYILKCGQTEGQTLFCVCASVCVCVSEKLRFNEELKNECLDDNADVDDHRDDNIICGLNKYIQNWGHSFLATCTTINARSCQSHTLARTHRFGHVTCNFINELKLMATTTKPKEQRKLNAICFSDCLSFKQNEQ